MEILRTHRLILRTWRVEDLPAAVRIYGDPDVMKYVDAGHAEPVEEIRRSLQAGLRHQDKFGFQHWAVVEVSSGQVIGACGFNVADEPGEIELVFHFAKSAWGRGYATEAAQACVDHARGKIRATKIIAGCHPANEASKRVLLKCGLTFVGNRWFEDTRREEPYFEMRMPANRLREIDPDSAEEIALVAARMRQTLIEVLGQEKGTALYSMEWLLDRVRWHLDPRQTTGKVFLSETPLGEISGHAIARIDYAADRTPFGYLSTVFVAPSHRKQGLASAFIAHAETWFRMQGLAKITYNTAEHHAPLIRIFERQGFQITHRADEMVQLTKNLS